MKNQRIIPRRACLWMAPILLTFFTTSKAQNCPDTTYTGTATFFTPGGTSMCSAPFASDTVYTVAMNLAQYDTAATCGACLLITGPGGSAVAVVSDLCNTCTANNLDLSADLQTVIDTAVRVTPIQWKYVGCPVTSNVQLEFDVSSAFYVELRVLNHRYAVKKLEYFSGTTYTALAKNNTNYFVATSGLGSGPFSFRITDVLGDTILETGIPLVNDSVINGSHQFPLCTQPNAIAELVNANSGMQIINDASKSNRFIIANHTLNSVDYIVYDILGRVIARGTAGSYAQQLVLTPSAGVYVVHYPHLEGGRFSQKVGVN